MAATVKNNPRPVMLSKRANVFYLEHVRVIQKNHRIVYLTQDGGEIERFFNLPERNTAFILLGKGSSITDAAARRLAEANVMVGFCGSGGSPLFGALDMAFMVPQSEYRPTEYMQAWMRLWLDEEKRLQLGKELLCERVRFAEKKWTKNSALCDAGFVFPTHEQEKYLANIEKADNTQALLLTEARWAKACYALFAKLFNTPFTREEGKRSTATKADICNAFLDHGNYIAYGYAGVALCGLGISFSLPILHGKTRRGALVFDMADLVKDALVMPTAFIATKQKLSEKDFRNRFIELCQKEKVLDYLFDFIIASCKKYQ